MIISFEEKTLLDFLSFQSTFFCLTCSKINYVKKIIKTRFNWQVKCYSTAELSNMKDGDKKVKKYIFFKLYMYIIKITFLALHNSVHEFI